jgi:hypothetical protein
MYRGRPKANNGLPHTVRLVARWDHGGDRRPGGRRGHRIEIVALEPVPKPTTHNDEVEPDGERRCREGETDGDVHGYFLACEPIRASIAAAVRLVARRHIIDPLLTLEHAPDDIALSGPKGVAYQASLCSLTEPSRDLPIGWQRPSPPLRSHERPELN